MATVVGFCAAGLLASGGGAADARTLRLTAQRLHDPHAQAKSLHLVVEEQADSGSVRLGAEHLEIRQLALAGRIEWSCQLARRPSGARGCAGPLHFQPDNGPAQDAALAATIADQHIELALTRDGGRVVLTIPFSGPDPQTVSLQDVPAQWLKAPLALAWKGGELRSGLFDGRASRQTDGHIEAHYAVTDLAFDTRDGSIAGNRLALSGDLAWAEAGPATRVVAAARMTAGAMRIGALQVELPDSPVDADLDVTLRADGRWQIARFAWRDPEALVFEANGELDPSASTPISTLAMRIGHARFPLATRRYAKDVLAAQGLGRLTLKGDLAGEVVFDRSGPQRVALTTPALDLQDTGLGVALRGIVGGIDWSSTGRRPPTTLGWKSARIEGIALSSVSARWQSSEGALHLLERLRVKVFGGTLELDKTVLVPRPGQGEFLRSAFALSGLGYDSKDGSLAAANVGADGQLTVAGSIERPHLRVQADFRGGEFLAGPVYVKLPHSPVAASVDATGSAAQWRIDAFDWNDPGVLAFGASGVIATGDAPALAGMRLELREAKIGPAVDRYAHSWLASRGFVELHGSGSLAATLQFDLAGLQRLAFDAHAIDLRDGAGRFAFSAINGGVDWDAHADSRATTLGWKSFDLFRIPFGASTARLQSLAGAIVLAQPLDVAVLGGKVTLEKLSLQPRSPRGERYSASFAVAGIEMAQLSAALGWPRFGGNLSGGIPQIELVGDTIQLHGGLDLYVFDGHLGVSSMTIERPFGVAPSLGADIHFENLDLDQVTSAFSFGGISGHLDGTIGNLRLVDWSPAAFDALLRTNGGGRMSYTAVNDLTSIGGGGGLSGGVQTMALKLFDTFGYRRLGIRCRLRDEVCLMGGIEPLPTDTATQSGAGGYTIVEGSGIPRITIVGYHRSVDWPTLVRRLVEATQGQGPVVR